MSEHDAILFANAAFYAAFSTHDARAMENVWAADKLVSCIHPGRTAITGREAVMRSWQAILGNPEVVRITPHAEKVHVQGDIAIVTCVEQVVIASGPQFLVATNIFVKTGAIWTMVHHHAGPAEVDPRLVQNPQKPALN
ncbi:MAG: nuclear transport factor 2 family protein [Proteobacteria bacterium]|nr:nuclear transport factor 2 family protein [Pseudomonadota bacterium]